MPIVMQRFPDLKRFAAIGDADDADRFRLAGLLPVLEAGRPDGIETAMAILAELGVDSDAATLWARRQRQRATGSAGEALVAA